MAPVSSLFLTFLISLFNLNGAVSISIAISLSPNSKLKTQNPKLSPIPYILSPRPRIFDCSFQVQSLPLPGLPFSHSVRHGRFCPVHRMFPLRKSNGRQ